jgi:hypothetical protein
MDMFNVTRCRLLLCSALGTLLVFILYCGHLEAVDDPRKDDEERRDLQLKNMKRSAAQYAMSSAADRKRVFKFHENAAMRLSNPVIGTKDGAVYLWSDGGRPQAIMKLYTYDEERFNHEFQSLSESAIVAERDGNIVWKPTEPGIKYQEVPDAPKPAESAAERLRQMKSLAGKFSATYTHMTRDSEPVELRLLIQPLFRFETKDNPQYLDGALFGFAQGTAPLGLLSIEARKDETGYRYHYAVARMASGAVAAKIGGKEIFSVEKYDLRRDPKQPFLILAGQPVPKE